MANFNETIITQQEVKQWLAAKEITFVNNHEDSGKHATIYNVIRESVDGVFTKETPAGAISRPLTSMAEKIPYIDEDYNQILDANGLPIDGYCFTVQTLYQMLACLFVDTVVKHQQNVRGAQ